MLFIPFSLTTDISIALLYKLILYPQVFHNAEIPSSKLPYQPQLQVTECDSRHSSW